MAIGVGLALAVAAAGSIVWYVTQPDCVSIDRDAALAGGWQANVTAAVAGPKDAATGDTVWYYASPTGGLWVSTADPLEPNGGFGGPMNSQARREDELGVLAGSTGSLFDDTSARSREARAALKCARP